MSGKSALYTGVLHHRRTSPKVHDFKYQVALFYLDLSEIETIFNLPLFFSHRAPSLAGFRREDYLKGDPSLTQAVKDLILARTGKTHDGPIRLLTQIRYFGFCFNPVSFYYCFDQSEKLQFIVSEITNTPWNERFAYVSEVKAGDDSYRFEFKKDFHVSPFLPMDLQYIWKFNVPKPTDPKSALRVHMEDWDLKTNERVFESNLVMKPMPMTRGNLARLVFGYPLLTIKTILAIYFQAVLLKLKGATFYTHPKTGEKQ